MNELPLRKRLYTLFTSMLLISAFTFGGGFVITGIMKKKFVDKLQWMDEEEMLDFIAIAQSCPGPIAVNCAILVGWRVAGLAGMISAVIGTILPPMAILSIVSVFYGSFSENVYVARMLKGMQAGVAAVLVDVVCGLSGKLAKERSVLSVVIALTAFCAVRFLNIGTIPVIAAAIVFGVTRSVYGMVSHKKGGAK